MQLTLTTALVVLAVAAPHAAQAATLELASPVKRATLIELYTSEGCNSCPPADRRLSRLKEDDRLWRDIVPVAFHVDYWNRLGWRDRFSSAAFSARQSTYQEHRYLKVLYTPGWISNGREWRGWFTDRESLPLATTDAGVLRAVIGRTGASAEFTPSQPLAGPLTLNVAWLGFDLHTDVAAGENAGQRLRHDFVVLAFRHYPAASGNERHRWRLDDLPATIPADATAVALWVTAAPDPTPLQATGGWLQ